MFKRHLSRELLAAASRMPVVTVTGPRQSGKTTLARALFPEHAYVSLEEPDERARATDDPRGFLARFERQAVVLDEVQRAPELFSYLQGIVDRNPRPGHFILTGSQNFSLMRSVAQTLAGRTAILHLLPLSLSELYDREPLDVERLPDPSAPTAPPPPTEVWTALFAGFFPRIHADGLDPGRWLADYRRTYVDRDLRELVRVSDLTTFDTFLRLTAARTGQELNLSDLASDAGVSQPTARAWLDALAASFLVTTLAPHHESFRKRLRKRRKLHFLDTGLACQLLGIASAEALALHSLRGALFESFVVGELFKAFVNEGREPPLFFWRDAGGHEIDILIDRGDHLIPIEVKSGLTVPPDAVAGLRYWTELPGNPNRGGVLIHGGTSSFGLHGFAVRPWFLA